MPGPSSPAAAALAAAVAALDPDPPAARLRGAPRLSDDGSLADWPAGAMAPRPADGAWVARWPAEGDGPRVCVKDLIDVAGVPTRAGTSGWSRTPGQDAPAVAALRAAGGVVVGKGHTVEFAYGIDGLNPHLPPCPNPWDPARLPGGSSSGPAVAVACGEADIGLGTDTSGSIRTPAALCGLVGLRPTHGLVPTVGVVALSPSLDVVGPLARDVATLRWAYDALVVEASAQRAGPGSLTVGVVLSGLPPCSPRAAAAVARTAARLREQGASLAGVDLPCWPAGAAAQRVVQFAEAAAQHAGGAFPGARRSAPVADRLAAGAALGAEGRARGREAAAAFRRRLLELLEEVDVLLLPAAGDIAPRADADPAVTREQLLGPVAALGLTGGPALTLPVAAHRGLPVAVQLAAAPGHDRRLLDLAAALGA